jgi:hypothetical protein
LPASVDPTHVLDDLGLDDVLFDEREESRMLYCSSFHLFFSMRVMNRLLPLFG